MKTPPLLTPAQEKLVKKWIPLAYGIVAKQVGGDRAEQLSRALWGLAKFARRYDPARGYSEQALATRAVRTAMIDCHRAAARHLNNVELQDHHLGAMAQGEQLEPPPKWTPPPDAAESRVRAPGLSRRSIQRRAKEQGWARPRGGQPRLDGQSLLRILDKHPRLSTTALARSLGVHRNIFHRCSANRQLLARCRELAKVRIFGHVETRDRASTPHKGPGTSAAQSWG